jgi:hypothetical protein
MNETSAASSLVNAGLATPPPWRLRARGRSHADEQYMRRHQRAVRRRRRSRRQPTAGRAISEEPLQNYFILRSLEKLKRRCRVHQPAELRLGKGGKGKNCA